MLPDIHSMFSEAVCDLSCCFHDFLQAHHRWCNVRTTTRLVRHMNLALSDWSLPGPEQVCNLSSMLQATRARLGVQEVCLHHLPRDMSPVGVPRVSSSSRGTTTACHVTKYFGQHAAYRPHRGHVSAVEGDRHGTADGGSDGWDLHAAVRLCERGVAARIGQLPSSPHRWCLVKDRCCPVYRPLGPSAYTHAGWQFKETPPPPPPPRPQLPAHELQDSKTLHHWTPF